jgi:hypothetical protein
MTASALPKLRELSEALARVHVRVGTADELVAPSRPTGWAELDAFLPDGGLPLGVVELACAPADTRAHAYAGATAIATFAIARAHRDERAYCAWVDVAHTLHAPGLLQAGVDVERLLVVRPTPEQLGLVAVKVASSGAFDVVVVELGELAARPGSGRASKREAPELFVRKLALAAEASGVTVLLLTEPTRMPTRAVPWPVAMRLDLARVREGLAVGIPKERRGRITTAKVTLPLPAAPISPAA